VVYKKNIFIFYWKLENSYEIWMVLKGSLRVLPSVYFHKNAALQLQQLQSGNARGVSSFAAFLFLRFSAAAPPLSGYSLMRSNVCDFWQDFLVCHLPPLKLETRVTCRMRNRWIRSGMCMKMVWRRPDNRTSSITPSICIPAQHDRAPFDQYKYFCWN